MNQQEYDWLMQILTKAWCNHAFCFYPKCDVLMNKLSEAFNITILLARDKPIITICKWIEQYLMSRIAKTKAKVENYRGEVMPKPMNRLNMKVEKSGHWIPRPCGREQFEVKYTMGTEQFVVDLARGRCTSRY